jgi:hypothetical protein
MPRDIEAEARRDLSWEEQGFAGEDPPDLLNPQNTGADADLTAWCREYADRIPEHVRGELARVLRRWIDR